MYNSAAENMNMINDKTLRLQDNLYIIKDNNSTAMVNQSAESYKSEIELQFKEPILQ